MSAIRLNSTIRIAKMKASVCTIGRSLAWIAPISGRADAVHLEQVVR